jgi:hypothetical protein
MITSKKNNIIEFNSNYPKLWEQTSAKLVEVFAISAEYIERGLHKGLIEYDTLKSDESHCELKKGQDYLVLFLIGNRGIPFTTLRRFKAGNGHYFFDKGKTFKIEIESNRYEQNKKE